MVLCFANDSEIIEANFSGCLKREGVVQATEAVVTCSPGIILMQYELLIWVIFTVLFSCLEGVLSDKQTGLAMRTTS